jgi:hypothetical protein
MPETVTSAPPAASEIDAQLDNLNWLLAETRTELRFVLTAFGAVVEGMELAAEQVQDKRLEFVETPPDVSVGEALVSVLMAFGLFNLGMPVTAVAKAIEAEYVSILATRRTALFEQVMDRMAGGLDWRKGLEQKSVAFEHLKSVVEGRMETVKQTNEFLSFFAKHARDIGEGTAAGAKSVHAELRKQAAPVPPGATPVGSATPGLWDPRIFGPQLAPGTKRVVQRGFDPKQGGDSPSVAVQRDLRTKYREMQFFVDAILDQAQHDLLACIIARSPEKVDLLTADLLTIYDAADKAAKQISVSLGRIRDEAFVLYEKVIWMLLYGQTLYVNPAIVHDPVDDDRLILGKPSPPPQPLVKYWWGRFPSPADGRPFPSQPTLLAHLQADVAVKLERFRLPNDFAPTLK